MVQMKAAARVPATLVVSKWSRVAQVRALGKISSAKIAPTMRLSRSAREKQLKKDINGITGQVVMGRSSTLLITETAVLPSLLASAAA